jgi:hypothetical protein
MNTNYPHRHSHTYDSAGKAVRPVCAYCLHLLANSSASVQLSAAKRRALEDTHECVEKVTARQPQVALPFN